MDRLVNAGADLIKVYTRVDPTLLKAVIDEASTFNLPVTGHLGLTDAVTAATTGISSIEHLSGRARGGLARPFVTLRGPLARLLCRLDRVRAELGGARFGSLGRVAKASAASECTILVPTLVLHETFSRLDDPTVLQDTMLRAVPAAERARWNVPEMVAARRLEGGRFPAFRPSRRHQDLFLRLFAAAGGRIAAGTDASSQLLIPGYSMHRELQLLVAAGFSPRDVLLAATRNGALLLGVDSIGIVAPGKSADLVILTRDPMSRIQNTLAIEQVMARGILYRADSLRASWQ